MDANDFQQAATIEVAQSVADAPAARQRWIDLGLVLLLSILPSMVGAAHEMMYPSGRSGGWSNYHFVTGLLHQGSCMLLLLYVLSRQKRTFASLGLAFRWSDPWVALGLAVAAFVLVGILGLLAKHASLHFLGRPADIRHPDMDTGIVAVLVLAYSIASPIFEETLVRGYLMTELIDLGKPVWLATLASILLQTSYHVYYGLAGAVSISGIFIVFALYFAFSRRLLPVILAHLYWDIGVFFLKHH